MSLALKKSLVFLSAGIIYLIGQYFRGVWFLGSGIPNFCGDAFVGGQQFCNSPYLDTLGWPLIIAGGALFAVAVILAFANEAGFKRWLWFSLFFVPIAILVFVFFAHEPIGSIGAVIWAFTHEDAAHDLGGVYIGATLIIVLWGHYKAVKQAGR